MCSLDYVQSSIRVNLYLTSALELLLDLADVAFGPLNDSPRSFRGVEKGDAEKDFSFDAGITILFFGLDRIIFNWDL